MAKAHFYPTCTHINMLQSKCNGATESVYLFCGAILESTLKNGCRMLWPVVDVALGHR